MNAGGQNLKLLSGRPEDVVVAAAFASLVMFGTVVTRYPQWLGAVVVSAGVLVVALSVRAFAPRADVRGPSRVALGDHGQISCRAYASIGRIDSWQIFLEQHERMAETGYDGRLHRNRVFREELVAAGGPLRFVVPAAGMHSFAARRCAIEWCITVVMTTAYWPVAREERFMLEVLPTRRQTYQADFPNIAPDHVRATAGPPHDSRTQIVLDDPAGSFRPGDTVTGSALWSYVRAPRALAVRLAWSSDGKGTPEDHTVETQDIAGPASSDRVRFRFTFPDVPYSYNGSILSIDWYVQLVTHRRGSADPTIDVIELATHGRWRGAMTIDAIQRVSMSPSGRPIEA